MYGEKLKELREEQNIKQYELEQIISVGRDMYGQYEREAQTIPLKHLNTLCNYFNVSLDYIFSFTNIRQYKNNHKDINITLISKRLKEVRKKNNLTQIKLAKILNTVSGTIANYETERHLIATPFLYTICKKFNVSADYLLGKIDNPKYFEK